MVMVWLAPGANTKLLGVTFNVTPAGASTLAFQVTELDRVLRTVRVQVQLLAQSLSAMLGRFSAFGSPPSSGLAAR